MKKEVKKKRSIVIAFLLGGIVFGSIGVYAAVKLSSSEISYDNKQSGMKATTMQGAIDELYEKANSCENGSSSDGNFVAAYTYNETEGSSNYCITGEEETCKKTTCYKEKEENSCRAGDIIKYKVNDMDVIIFHVMYDKGNKLIMQSQKEIGQSIWVSKEDYIKAGGTVVFNDYYNTDDVFNDKGPITAIKTLEDITKDWTNVNSQTYQMGTTVFVGDNADTGCSSYPNTLDCSINTYTWEERTAKSRMITFQEAVYLGCTLSSNSCPKWLSSTKGYSTMSTLGQSSPIIIGISNYINTTFGTEGEYGIRAVIDVSK